MHYLQDKPKNRPTHLIPFREFLESMGRSESTGWRWRRDGMLRVLNIAGKNYITLDEIERFERRAENGEFVKSCKPPHRV